MDAYRPPVATCKTVCYRNEQEQCQGGEAVPAVFWHLANFLLTLNCHHSLAALQKVNKHNALDIPKNYCYDLCSWPLVCFSLTGPLQMLWLYWETHVSSSLVTILLKSSASWSCFLTFVLKALLLFAAGLDATILASVEQKVCLILISLSELWELNQLYGTAVVSAVSGWSSSLRAQRWLIFSLQIDSDGLLLQASSSTLFSYPLKMS